MINFFNEDIDFELSDRIKTTQWLNSIVEESFGKGCEVNFIFCSDEFLLNINQDYLAHDYYTDIITFKTSEPSEPLTSDIFISIDRIRDNAKALSNSFEKELHRVMAHGLIHLMGYEDETPDQKQVMRNKEDSYLSLLS
ncbi:MAG: rRNA maturation RNase YbeY [Bacteroidota bacterium]